MAWQQFSASSTGHALGWTGDVGAALFFPPKLAVYPAPVQDEMLRKAVSLHGAKNWRTIGEQLEGGQGGTTAASCRCRLCDTLGLQDESTASAAPPATSSDTLCCIVHKLVVGAVQAAVSPALTVTTAAPA